MTDRAWLRSSARSHTAIALVVAAVIGTLTNWTSQTPYGYNAGYNDHSVLSLEGLRWADPTKFVNDWFMNAAPQPHWFFDLITYWGQSAGLLSQFYFVYWIAGLVACGFATALIAKKWLPRHPWLGAIAFAIVISLTPWVVVGSASTMIATALPTVVGGQLIYLCLAALLTGRRTLACVAAPLVALVHVQLGAVLIVVLVVTLVVEFIRTRRADWLLAGSTVLTLAIVIFGLWLRPVASNLNDFITICDTIIPYHCAAQTWGKWKLLASGAFIVLSALTFFYVPRRIRPIWLATIGLAAFGLLAGMTVNAFTIPVLGRFAQATNIYRLAVMLLPFAVWGILLPVLRLGWDRKYAALLSVWFVMAALYITCDAWELGPLDVKLPLAVGLLAITVVTAWAHKRVRSDPSRRIVARSGAALFAVVMLLTAALTGGLVVRPLDITFVPDSGLRAWGAAVEKIVPSGDIILADSRAQSIRLVTGRAVVADCKNVPYGGKPWREWNERINDLGGLDVCLNPANPGIETFSARHLDRVAAKYHATFMTIEPGQAERVGAGLQTYGWNKVLDSMPGVSAVLFEHRAD